MTYSTEKNESDDTGKGNVEAAKSRFSKSFSESECAHVELWKKILLQILQYLGGSTLYSEQQDGICVTAAECSTGVLLQPYDWDTRKKTQVRL
jgi:hypothetical protein